MLRCWEMTHGNNLVKAWRPKNRTIWKTNSLAEWFWLSTLEWILRTFPRTLEGNNMFNNQVIQKLDLDVAVQKRLNEARTAGVEWKKWGPYLSERQWGTVREDYSTDGDAWNYFSHDQSRSR